MEGISPLPMLKFRKRVGKLMCVHPRCGEASILDVRGWGFLTGRGHGALGLDAETAATIQEGWGEEVEKRCNLYPELVEALERLVDWIENEVHAEFPDARISAILAKCKAGAE